MSFFAEKTLMMIRVMKTFIIGFRFLCHQNVTHIYMVF